MQAVDLFSGAGGMSVGAALSGINVRYAVERDPMAAATFALNHPETSLFSEDIREVHSHRMDDLDPTDQLVLFGGPPCQGFSTSNQKTRNANNPNNWLFAEYLRLARELTPDWIVFENVKGLLETENGAFLDLVLAGFTEAGYTTNHFVLNAADFGVPQRRNRLFIIGSRNGIVLPPPKPTVTKPVTVEEAIGDLPPLENGANQDVLPYATAPLSPYSAILRNGLEACSNHLVTQNAAHILIRYRHIPPGGNWTSIPEHLMKNYTDRSRCHTGIYHRLSHNEPSIVVGNYRKNMLVHPTQDRGLSVREAARLQSFPDKFQFCGSIGFQQQQVGNAVPPLLAKAIFDQLLRYAET